MKNKWSSGLSGRREPKKPMITRKSTMLEKSAKWSLSGHKWSHPGKAEQWRNQQEFNEFRYLGGRLLWFREIVCLHPRSSGGRRPWLLGSFCHVSRGWNEVQGSGFKVQGHEKKNPWNRCQPCGQTSPKAGNRRFEKGFICVHLRLNKGLFLVFPSFPVNEMFFFEFSASALCQTSPMAGLCGSKNPWFQASGLRRRENG